MNVKAISRHVGASLLVNALFMFFSILVSLVNGHDSALAALFISFTITLTVGVFPFIFVRKAAGISMAEGYVIIVLAWLLSFIFGMLPYALWGGPFTVINAWFESVSGYTTTGATILENVEGLPDSLLFWRSSTHFIGGLGVVVFLLLLIPSASQTKLRLSSLEISSLSKSGYKSRARKTVSIFTNVYIGLVLSAFLCYWIAGMTPFDAICHAMSVAATGGFSTRNLSIASFQSLPITLITMVYMVLASMHFGLIFLALVRRSLKPLNNEVLKFYLWGLVVGSLLVGITLKAEGVEQNWGHALLNGSFHIISYASTTGFAIADNSAWPYLASVLLIFFGIRCGMAGSTTGGVKSDRVLLFYKQIGYYLKHALYPSSINEVRLNGRVVKQEDVAPHILFVSLFLVVMMLSFLICLILGVDNRNAFIGTISCLSNVGPSVGALGTFGNYNIEPAAAKFMYTLNMFLGRVEIYPVFAVVSMIFGRKPILR
ncbi:MAG: TrkH family potassium uptake protein [Candidatus Cryptobacteroides sp.]|jgi:trk system potassium uptake protein TrkH|nr:potassium transporter TrkG [Bacteroidota bacterium]NLN99188.1 TrkH family potassium uptake protein [Bacteroidales bacterium]